MSQEFVVKLEQTLGLEFVIYHKLSNLITFQLENFRFWALLLFRSLLAIYMIDTTLFDFYLSDVVIVQKGLIIKKMLKGITDTFI